MRYLLMMALIFCAGCAQEIDPGPPIYTSLAHPGSTVDAGAARDLINAYRQQQGLGQVVLDPLVTGVAAARLQEMTREGKAERSLKQAELTIRLKAAGLQPGPVAANVSAGYHTVAEAFSGWRESPDHNKTMLLAGATRMGLAAAYVPGSKYKVFWVLVMSGDE